MKKQTAAFFLSLYGLQAIVCGPLLKGADDLWEKAALVCILLTLVLGISILIGAIGLSRRLWDDPKGQAVLRREALVIKLLSVPFFVVNLMIWLLVEMAFLVVPGLFVLMPMVLLGVGFAYLVVVVTSSFSLAGLVLAVRAGRVSPVRAAFHAVPLMIFVVDVPDAVFVHRLLRRSAAPVEQSQDAGVE